MTETLTREQYLAEVAPKKRGNKYGAKKTVVDGITFDSKREAEVYGDLKLLEKAGKISGFTRQRKFNLIVEDEIVGAYFADFCFIDHDQDGRLRVIDVKGFDTKLSAWKRKHVKALYGIEVEIIR